MKKDIFMSSANPQEVALTVKGLLLGIIPLLTVALPALGISFNVGEYQQFADLLVEAVSAFMGFASVVMVIWGLGRKAYYAFANRAK
jgi:Na+-translocating ferredoxin:NAD+ oxidoreductase RnfA subunit